MRLKLALAVVTAALASVIVLPAAAQAAPDSLACAAAGSYSKVVDGTPTTFWLVGSVSTYRYWHVVDATSDNYQRSYVVRCSGETVVTATDLAVTATGGDRCGSTSTTQFQYVGARTGLEPNPGWPGFYLEYEYHYWHVKRWVWSGFFGYWTYDHSELARCLI
ncbi:hypothetical protein ACFO0M_22390 [Micromonospora mangrovi]|uniref:Secreted protein n=2 Tax=Micromonospora TaxID=1873 RepID=A0AAU8H9L4_9ACTN